MTTGPINPDVVEAAIRGTLRVTIDPTKFPKFDTPEYEAFAQVMKLNGITVDRFHFGPTFDNSEKALAEHGAPPYPGDVKYIGTVVNLDTQQVSDVLLFDNQQECIDNIVDSLVGTEVTDIEAKVWQHTDLDNGDQECIEVWDLSHLPQGET